MTSRYRAAQRAVELFNALQGEGLTTDEIAAELRRRGALDRKRASDPAADLYANVRDMVADFAKAMGQPPVEDALHARAEAAEQRAEAAESEAERLRSAIAETLRLADIYAGVAAHNAEVEPETAGEAWRSAGAATVRELRRAIGGAA